MMSPGVARRSRLPAGPPRWQSAGSWRGHVIARGRRSTGGSTDCGPGFRCLVRSRAELRPLVLCYVSLTVKYKTELLNIFIADHDMARSVVV